MSLFDNIIAKIVPHDCLGCGAEGSLLCDNCAHQLPVAMPNPYPVGHLKRLQSVTTYNKVAKDLLWKLKSNGAQAAAMIMAARMMPLLASVAAKPDSLIVPVPTATNRVRQRGYDQAKLLSRELSRLAHLPCVDCLSRLGQAHQVGANRELRISQLSNAFRVKQPRLVLGRHIILVDDVITTGATLQTAAACLLRAGAESVEAVTFARA